MCFIEFLSFSFCPQSYRIHILRMNQNIQIYDDFTQHERIETVANAYQVPHSKLIFRKIWKKVHLKMHRFQFLGPFCAFVRNHHLL